jgi:hypothetical protein
MEGATAKDKKLYELLKTRSITPEQYSEQLLKEPSVNVTYKEFVDPTDNKEKVFKITTNATTGEEIERVALGAVADPASTKDPWSTRHGMEPLETARKNASTAAAAAGQLERAAAFAQGRNWWERGSAGAALSAAKEFAGIGDEVNYFRSQLNEIRMSGVLGMLPPGVASDKDVELALTTQVDFNNMGDEEAASFLRGMAKIKKAQQEYNEQKIRWMTKADDPNALGFDFWVQLKDAQRQIDELKTGPKAQEFLNVLYGVTAMPDSPAKEEELKALRQTFPDQMKVYDNLVDREKDWAGVKNKPAGFN